LASNQSVMKIRNCLLDFAVAAMLFVLYVRSTPAQATAPPSFQTTETLNYDVEWSVFTAGRITVQLVGAERDRPSEIITIARSQGVASLLYKVQDDYRSLFDPQTLCSRSISKKINEGRRHRELDITFKGDEGIAAITDRDLNSPGTTKHVEKKIPACTEDIVTAFYFMRHQPMHVGEPVKFAVNDGGDTVEIDADIQAEEQVQTPLGSRKALRVEPKVFGPLYKRKGRLLVWFSDDAEHLPLRLKLTLSVATVTATLKSVSTGPTVYPGK